MTDFRALCEELLSALENEGYAHWVVPPNEDELCLRARAALDEPVVEGPSDEELLEMWYGSDWFNEGATLRELTSIARTVLARWGHPAQPTSGEEPLGSDGGYEAGSMWIGHGTQFTLGDKVTKQEAFGEPNEINDGH